MYDDSKTADKRCVPFARPLLAAALAVTALAPAAPQAAVVDYFLKLEGIDGESTDDKHKNEIDVESWSLGFAYQIPANATGQQRTRGSVLCDGVTVYKRVDKASVKLLEALIKGKAIAKGVLTSAAAGKSARDFYTVELGDIVVTTLRQSGPPIVPEPGTALLESLTLQPASYKFSYSQQNADGSFDAPISFAGTCDR